MFKDSLLKNYKFRNFLLYIFTSKFTIFILANKLEIFEKNVDLYSVLILFYISMSL